MKTIKNILFVVLVTLAMMVLLSGIFMLINGSLEAFPTEEQVEKTRILGWLFTVIGGVLELIFVTVLYKNNRREKS